MAYMEAPWLAMKGFEKGRRAVATSTEFENIQIVWSMSEEKYSKDLNGIEFFFIQTLDGL